MVWKLLRKNISAGQIIGYSLASLVGLAIVISAVKFYDDVKSAFNDEDSFISKDYIIISKKVSAINTLGAGAKTTFTAADIDEIKNQPWVREVGDFRAADFSVDASLDIEGRGLSTHLFFEAIPDDFFDVSAREWAFDSPGDPNSVSAEQLKTIEIPVIISRDYLTLYNFGYAASRGMPQLNENLIKSVPLTFNLSGNGHHDSYRGRIVGFSSRLNTIAVPQDFIDWANKRYATVEATEPSRLIIEANTPGDPEISKFMENHSYEIAGDKADNGRANYFLTVATTIVIAVGAVITVLAFFILMLSIYLLLQKNKSKLQDLMLLGFSPSNVAKSYYLLISGINLAVLVLAVVIMLLASGYWVKEFNAIGITSASPLMAITVGVCISVVVTFLNCLAINRIVRKNFYTT